MTAWVSKHKNLFLRALGTILATGLIIFLIRREGWDQITDSLKQIPPAVLLLALFFALISRLLVSFRWHVLLRSGGITIPLLRTIQLTLTGLFASNYLPTTIGGDVVRLGGVISLGYDRAICLASIAADRLVGMVGMFCAAPFGLIPAWNTLGAAHVTLSAMPPMAKKIAGFIRRLLDSFSIWFKQPVALISSLLCTWGNMIFIFAIAYILIQGLGEHVSYALIAGVWSLAYFVTLIPISINGYGVQELSLTFLFSHIAGLSPAVSLTVAVLMRVIFLAASLPGAFFLPSVMAAVSDARKGSS
ncbi:MAG: flippase-like domain-containing protein [Anaerolineales bacterium]|nr:flippase-like domain-containing protein [Anaerolineales bacterium]MCL4260559.1 flippase-like domain-containing protein [Anaerolineales bacterium]